MTKLITGSGNYVYEVIRPGRAARWHGVRSSNRRGSRLPR